MSRLPTATETTTSLNRRSSESMSPTAENTRAMRPRLTLSPYFWYFWLPVAPSA
jgi:hypothetical protein